MSEKIVTVTLDWGDDLALARGEFPERPAAVVVDGVRYEPVADEDGVNRAALVLIDRIPDCRAQLQKTLSIAEEAIRAARGIS